MRAVAFRNILPSNWSPALSFLDQVDALSPVAHWRMDETSDTTITDRIGSAVATLNGTAGVNYNFSQPSLLKDDTDASIKFNSNGYAYTAASSKWALGTGDYSFFVIAKWTYTAQATILNCRDSSASNVLAQIVINRATTGDVGVEGSNFGTPGAYYRTTDTPYNDGKPHGIGLTFDSATGIMRLTIDGVYKGSNTVAIPRPTAATMRANIANNYATQGFLGTVDEVMFFDHKLSDADMAGLASHVATS